MTLKKAISIARAEAAQHMIQADLDTASRRRLSPRNAPILRAAAKDSARRHRLLAKVLGVLVARASKVKR